MWHVIRCNDTSSVYKIKSHPLHQEYRNEHDGISSASPSRPHIAAVRLLIVRNSPEDRYMTYGHLFAASAPKGTPSGDDGGNGGGKLRQEAQTEEDIAVWLAGIGLEVHADAFVRAGLVVSVMPHVNNADLQAGSNFI